MIPILIGITVLSFGVMRLAPGGPAEAQMEFSAKASAEARERLRKLYGADQPFYKQYATWLTKFVTLDFGDGLCRRPQGQGQDPRTPPDHAHDQPALARTGAAHRHTLSASCRPRGNTRCSTGSRRSSFSSDFPRPHSGWRSCSSIFSACSGACCRYPASRAWISRGSPSGAGSWTGLST